MQSKLGAPRLNCLFELGVSFEKAGAIWRIHIVGDATMSPYEIVYPGGSVEHWNEEAGADWMRRVLATYPRAIWLNPQPKDVWDYYESIRVINELMENRMFPMTIEGLDSGIRELSR